MAEHLAARAQLYERLTVGLLVLLATGGWLEGHQVDPVAGLLVLAAVVAATVWVMRRPAAGGLVERVARRAALASVVAVAATTILAGV